MKDKNQLNREELDNKLWRITEILITAKECFLYSKYLYKPESEEEAKYLQYSVHFHFIRHSLWRLSIIELSKLFSTSKQRDRFNIVSFITQLKKDGHFANLNFDESIITKWEKRLSENKDQIDKILTLRDKVYAHTDPKKDDYRGIQLYLRDIEQLFLIVENMISEIKSKIFDAHMDLTTPVFGRHKFDIIKVLAEEKRKRIESNRNRMNLDNE